jgi:hypothetical protein
MVWTALRIVYLSMGFSVFPFQTDHGLRSDIHQKAPDEAEVDPSEDHHVTRAARVPAGSISAN